MSVTLIEFHCISAAPIPKVRFCQNVQMFLSYLQSDEHFTFLKLKILINCSEIENVLMLQCIEACKGKKSTFGWLGQPLKLLKFKLSVSGKKNVGLFGVMTKASVLASKTYL